MAGGCFGGSNWQHGILQRTEITVAHTRGLGQAEGYVAASRQSGFGVSRVSRVLRARFIIVASSSRRLARPHRRSLVSTPVPRCGWPALRLGAGDAGPCRMASGQNMQGLDACLTGIPIGWGEFFMPTREAAGVGVGMGVGVSRGGAQGGRLRLRLCHGCGEGLGGVWREVSTWVSRQLESCGARSRQRC